MPIFEGWKVWKRNMPTSVYNPRLFAAIIATYLAHCTLSNFLRENFTGKVKIIKIL
jgi:hypothetical protein